MKENTDGKLLLTGGNIVTMSSPARAEALLIEGDRIARVGSARELAAAVPPDVRRIELNGRTLVPGFNDNHIHVIIMGDQMSSLTLTGMNEREIVEALLQRFAGVQKGELIYAFGWDFPSAPEPHRQLLDSVFPDNPVYLAQFSGHGAWVNTRMLEKMGVKCSEGACSGSGVGDVITDTAGNPTGVLRESFGNPYVRRALMSRWMKRSTIRNALDAALPALSAAGITTVQDNTWFPPVLPVLRSYRSRAALPLRFSCWKYGEIPLLAQWMRLMRYDPLWFHRGPWKYFADGAFSSHSAWLSAPYADDPSTAGDGIPADRLEKILRPRVARREQVACHAIGDRSVSAFCDAVEQLSARYPGVRELRWRIEHGQLIRPQDIERIAGLGILVAAQPSALVDPEKDRRLLGAERASRAYPYRSLLDAGVGVSFGSDFPGEGLFAPLEVMHLAVNRESDEAVTAGEALAAYTSGSAYAEGREGEKGVLRSGYLADIAVLSGDPLSVPSARIRDLRVEMTITGGRIVYRR